MAVVGIFCFAVVVIQLGMDTNDDGGDVAEMDIGKEGGVVVMNREVFLYFC